MSLYVDDGYVDVDYVQSSIHIDWANKIIHIPKSELTLIQTVPVEIRNMDLNWFRLELKKLECSVEGMTYPDTHRHNTEVNLGGLTFARVIEIINDYTITFEDGQYAVNLIGANSNVGDRVNVNQVSVRSANSAGMTSSPAIEYASFNGGVTLDQSSPYSGTAYPIGTPQQPVNNLDDAMLIVRYRGFTTIYVVGDTVIDHGGDYREMNFIGSSKTKTHMHISQEAQVDQCEFSEAYITGTLDGNSTLKSCMISDLEYVTGFIEECVLSQGTITIGGGYQAHFLNCWNGVIGASVEIPVIDMGGVGQSLAVRNYNGSFKIINKTGPESITIDLNSGQVQLDLNTVTGGIFRIRGIGKCINSETGEHIKTGQYGDLFVLNELISKDNIAEAVWDEPLVNHIEIGSTGSTMSMQQYKGAVCIDTDHGLPGITFPVGIAAYPSNNITDAEQISTNHAFSSFIIKHTLAIQNKSFSNIRFTGAETFSVDALSFDNCIINAVLFENIKISGSLPGIDSFFTNCYIVDVQNISGEVTGGRISGNITVDPGKTLSGIEIVVEGDNTVIDLQNTTDTTVSLDVNSGIITFINAVEGCLIELNLRGGEIVLDASCTGGDFYAEGYGTLYNESNMNVTDNHLLALETIPGPVWNHPQAQQLQEDMSLVKDIEEGKWKIANNQMIFYKADNVTEVARFNLFDENGVPTSESVFERIRI